jgi:diguanylate cyclase (GGDEF)-like protein
VADQPRHVADLSEIQFKRDTFTAASRLAFLIFAAGMVYAAATWDEGKRPLIAALFGAMGVIAVILTALPAERVARGRFREPIFLAWSIASVGLIGAAVWADGGVDSPLTVMLFLPVVFAALSYPLASVAFIGALSELTLVGVGSSVGSPDPERLAMFATSLGFTVVLCAWQAELADRRRRELAQISRADPLTGCLNRRGFEERLSAELDEGIRAGRPLAIVMIDLDGFKQINDNEGHAAGDELLKWTVDTMEVCIRPMDALGRLGGDEFVVLLPGAGQAEAMDVASRIRECLAPRVGATTGVSAFPTNGIETEDLLDTADAELYAAKEGRAPRIIPGRRELSWAATLARAVELRRSPDGLVEGARRVAGFASAIGQQLGWSGAELGLLRLAAMLHDVGKVSLSDNALRSPERLTEAEVNEIRQHPVVGAQLIERVEGLETIAPWIRHSHEHFDGSGFPDGLAGDAIPHASRMLFAAATYESLTTGYDGREPLTPDAAIERLREDSGTRFDPACIDALERHVQAASAADAPAASA